MGCRAFVNFCPVNGDGGTLYLRWQGQDIYFVSFFRPISPPLSRWLAHSLLLYRFAVQNCLYNSCKKCNGSVTLRLCGVAVSLNLLQIAAFLNCGINQKLHTGLLWVLDIRLAQMVFRISYSVFPNIFVYIIQAHVHIPLCFYFWRLVNLHLVHYIYLPFC
jgi:hypothetical protein